MVSALTVLGVGVVRLVRLEESVGEGKAQDRGNIGKASEGRQEELGAKRSRAERFPQVLR